MSLVDRWDGGVFFRSLWFEGRVKLFLPEYHIMFRGILLSHTVIVNVLLLCNGGHIMEILILNVNHCFNTGRETP